MRKKRRHECNGVLCFHGAFTSPGRAEAKRKKLGKAAFVVKKFTRWGKGVLHTRWVVMRLHRETICPLCSGASAHKRGRA